MQGYEPNMHTSKSWLTGVCSVCRWWESTILGTCWYSWPSRVQPAYLTFQFM